MSRGGGVRRDPVCGKRITRNGAHIVIEYRNGLYYLCCPVCQAAFERHPERYAGNDRGARPGASRLTRGQLTAM